MTTMPHYHTGSPPSSHSATGQHSSLFPLTLHPDLRSNITTSNRTAANSTLPSWLDKDVYGMDADFYPYPGDVSRLTVPWVREPYLLPVVVLQVLTGVLGLAANGLVLAAVLCSTTTSTTTNTNTNNATGRFRGLLSHRPKSTIRRSDASFPCLLSVAAADVLFLAVCVPHEVAGHYLGHWGMAGPAAALCKVSGYVEMVSALAAVLNLVLISVERYFVIAHPLMSKSMCTPRKAKVALVSTWVASLLLSAPAFAVMDTEVNVYYNNTSYAVVVLCGDYGLQDGGRTAWALWQLLLLFVVPALVLVLCYSRVIVILWTSTTQLHSMTSSDSDPGRCNPSNSTSSRKMPGRSVLQCQRFEPHPSADRSLLAASSPHPHQAKVICSTPSPSSSPQLPSGHIRTPCTGRSPGDGALKARKQVIRMLVVIMVVFLLCWGPHLIINLIKRFHLPVYNEGTYHVWVMLSCLPYIHSLINPIVYVLMSKKIRQAILTIAPCLRCALASRCCPGQPHVKRGSPTHELLRVTHFPNNITGARTGTVKSSTVDTSVRSYYGASELTEV